MIVFAVHNQPTPGIDALPPSAKLVYKVLQASDQLTQKDLVRETFLPSRTVRYALTRLKDENLVIERLSPKDARQSLYALNPAGEVAPPAG
ncbi:MAG: helix-turn-helix domain-containing protein [Methanoregulaceae archaeon]